MGKTRKDNYNQERDIIKVKKINKATNKRQKTKVLLNSFKDLNQIDFDFDEVIE